MYWDKLRFKYVYKIWIVLLGGVSLVKCLDHFDKFREGSCKGVPVKPTPVRRSLVDGFRYVSAGSKYHLFRTVFALPNYFDIRDDEFYYDFCSGRNSTTTEPLAYNFGFGKLLEIHRIKTPPGTYYEATPLYAPPSWGTLRAVVTLTDLKSFGFISTCWTGRDERGWIVVSKDGEVDELNQKAIEDHIDALGYRRENAVFLNYNSCRKGLPFLERLDKKWDG